MSEKAQIPTDAIRRVRTDCFFCIGKAGTVAVREGDIERFLVCAGGPVAPCDFQLEMPTEIGVALLQGDDSLFDAWVCRQRDRLRQMNTLKSLLRQAAQALDDARYMAGEIGYREGCSALADIDAALSAAIRARDEMADQVGPI